MKNGNISTMEHNWVGRNKNLGAVDYFPAYKWWSFWLLDTVISNLVDLVHRTENEVSSISYKIKNMGV